ncbi:MAG: asparagine synthase (glutamine-hydrolyzing) [Acidiferrobacter sp.]
MCGIAGIVAFRGGARPTTPEVAGMICRIHHRGPDGQGFYSDHSACFGHARLSIIDIAGGAQPLANEDRTVWVTFNGEIFNYVELRRHLKKQGHAFSTQSDTEVIVHLYEEYGEDFPSHLNGQFAIALWDTVRKRLVLTRDPTGIRPLFIHRSRNRLYFGSEVKAIFACPEVPRSLHLPGVAQVLTYWGAPGTDTVFTGIESIGPGCTAVFDGDGLRRDLRYWDWRFPAQSSPDARSFQECLEGLDEALLMAVTRQVRSDVPVGAYISGGLDSAMIVAYMARILDAPLPTFSLRFADQEFDEGPYQKAVVQRFGTSHTEVMVSAGAIGRAFPQAVWHAESPILRTAPVPMMLLAQSVRAHGIKVVLTGEGADETLAGYDLFREARVRRFWARVPHSRMRPALLARLYPYLSASPAASAAYAQRFFGQELDCATRPGFGHWPRWQTSRRAMQFLNPDVRASLEFDYKAAAAALLPEGHETWDALCVDQYIEARTLLSGYILSSQGDRVALAHSVETRVPFLDLKVIEYANRLPARYKLMGLKEKYILKALGRGRIPDSVCERPKQPYRAPDSQSFFHKGVPDPGVAAAFEKKRLLEVGYFDAESACKLFDKCRRGKAIGFADNMAFVGIYSTMLLHEQFVEGRGVELGLSSELPEARVG